MSPTVDLVELPDKYSSTPVDDDQPLPKLDHLQNDASAMELHSIISYTLFLAFMSVLLLENLVGAASYTVGDAEGWTYGLDYQRWAQKYNFTVGDALRKRSPFDHQLISSSSSM